MRYLIFGNGYFAHKCKEMLPECSIDSSDITDRSAVKAAIEKYKPEVVINCAARTGRPNVDWCESHKLETLESNVRGPLTLLSVCEELGQYWVQFGSGCIYEGDNGGKGWSETDKPNFFGSYYSKTKALLNEALIEYPVLQIRPRMPIDGVPGPRNLITKLAGYKKVISVPNSISVSDDVIHALKILTDKKRTGIYNVANPGVSTHEEILALYKEIVDPSYSAEFISPKELDSMTAARRSNCILNTEKLESEGIVLPEIHERIRGLMQEYKTHHA